MPDFIIILHAITCYAFTSAVWLILLVVVPNAV